AIYHTLPRSHVARSRRCSRQRRRVPRAGAARGQRRRARLLEGGARGDDLSRPRRLRTAPGGAGESDWRHTTDRALVAGARRAGGGAARRAATEARNARSAGPRKCRAVARPRATGGGGGAAAHARVWRALAGARCGLARRRVARAALSAALDHTVRGGLWRVQ